MGCQNSASSLRHGPSPFIATSAPALDSLYTQADLAILTFHKDCGSMLIAIDTFETAAGGERGVPGMMAKALVATLIAVIGDLESSGLPTRPCRTMPGLQIAQFALTHDESRRAWGLWDVLSGELLTMITEVERYFPLANTCAGLFRAADKIIEELSNNTDIRVIDLRKLMMIVSFNNEALLKAGAEYHGAIGRIRSIITEVLAVLESLHTQKHLSRLKELGSAAAKIQAFDPLLVTEHFKSGIKDFVKAVLP